MAILTVGPTSTFPSIAAAMAAASANDIISLESGYSNETATVTHVGMSVDGGATSTGIVLQLGTGIPTFTLLGTAPINVLDAADANGITGNDGDNIITVTAGTDAVSGGLGTDRLVVDYHLATGAVTGNSTSNVTEAGGGARAVTINGGFENFTILTGSGTDTITTGAGDDIINTGEGTSTVTAGQGANIITGGTGADTITALDGGNIIDGGDGTNTLTSGGGADTITGGLGADAIVAGAGDDTVTVHGGADTANSGADDDRLIVDYAAAATAVTGGVTGGSLAAGYSGQLADTAGNSVAFLNTENFTVNSGSGNDVIATGDGIDVLNSGAGSDNLNAGGGTDTITAGLGSDIVNGGAGNDTINYAAGDGSDTIDGGADSDMLQITGSAGNDAIGVVLTGAAVTGLAGGTVVNVENVTLALGAGTADTLSYAGTTSAVNVNLAAASATGFGAISGVENVTGGSGPNTLTGDAQANALVGGSGADHLDGGTGVDTMNGGAGSDTYIVRNAADIVVEGATAGTDTVSAAVSFVLAETAQVEVLQALDKAGTADLKFTGNSFANTLLGNSGDNTLAGGVGADTLFGYRGADVLKGGSSSDSLYGGAGKDKLSGGSSADQLSGNSSADLLKGGEGDDVLTGGKGHDVVKGGAGADTFIGGKGADELGAGRDNASDTFVYSTSSDAGHTAASWDHILGFDKKTANEKVSDHIDLSAIDTDAKAGDQPFRFVTAFSHAYGKNPDGQLMLDAHGNNVKVMIDVNGDNHTDMIINVMHIDHLHKADFIL